MNDSFGGEPEPQHPNGRQPTSDSALFEERIADFESAWSAANPPGIAEYLGPPVANRRALALELALVDIELRAKAGLTFPLEDYRQASDGDEEFMTQVAKQIETWSRGEPSLDLPLEPGLEHGKHQDARGVEPLAVDGLATTLADEPDIGKGSEHADVSIPGYELLDRIGEGGMGVVYRARQIALGRIVALKVLHHGELASKSRRDRFKREAEILARIDDPCVVKIHDANLETQFPYLTMEHLNGGSLATRLDKGPMPPKAAAALVARLARAMHAVHEQHIIHRDIKPSNILFNHSGEPRICDFGLAKNLASDATRTRDGGFLGTPTYMAPEQIDPQLGEIGPATDVHALGNLLYECLTGRSPHTGADNLVLLERIRSAPPKPITSIDRRLPKDLQAVCEKCLQKQPKYRYRTAKQLADDLDRFLEGKSVKARSASTLTKGFGWVRRNRALAAVIALATILVVVTPIAVAYHLNSIRKLDAELLAENERIKLASKLKDEMKHAHKEWRDGRPALLLALFTRYSDKDILGSLKFAWNYLKTLRNEFERGAVQAHKGALATLWVDPDSRRVLTGGKDGVVRVWEKHAQKPIFEWKAGEQGVKTIGVVNGGKTLFTRHFDESLHFWRRGGQFTPLLDNGIQWPEKNALSALAPDGSFTIHAVSERKRSFVVRCDAKTGKELGRISTQSDMPIELLSFLGDSRVYLAKYSELVAAYEPDKNEPRWVRRLNDLRLFNSTANGRWIAAASGKEAAVLNPEGTELHRVRSRDADVTAVACSEDGLMLVSGDNDGIVDCWQLAPTLRLLGSYRAHLAAVTAAAFLPDSRTIVTGDAKGRLKFTDIGRTQDYESLRPTDPFAGPIALLPKLGKPAVLNDGNGLDVPKMETRKAVAFDAAQSTGNRRYGFGESFGQDRRTRQGGDRVQRFSRRIDRGFGLA